LTFACRRTSIRRVGGQRMLTGALAAKAARRGYQSNPTWPIKVVACTIAV